MLHIKGVSTQSQAAEAYARALTASSDTAAALANIVVDNGWPLLAYRYALNIPGAPIRKLAQVVINSKSSEEAYLFAKDIPDAPVEELAKVIIYNKNARLAYSFTRDVPGSPVEELAKVVIDSKNSRLAYWFAITVPDAPIFDLVPVINLGLPEDLVFVTKDFTLAQWKIAFGMADSLKDLLRTIVIAAALRTQRPLRTQLWVPLPARGLCACIQQPGPAVTQALALRYFSKNFLSDEW